MFFDQDYSKIADGYATYPDRDGNRLYDNISYQTTYKYIRYYDVVASLKYEKKWCQNN